MKFKLSWTTSREIELTVDTEEEARRLFVEGSLDRDATTVSTDNLKVEVLSDVDADKASK